MNEAPNSQADEVQGCLERAADSHMSRPGTAGGQVQTGLEQPQGRLSTCDIQTGFEQPVHAPL